MLLAFGKRRNGRDYKNKKKGKKKDEDSTLHRKGGKAWPQENYRKFGLVRPFLVLHIESKTIQICPTMIFL